MVDNIERVEYASHHCFLHKQSIWWYWGFGSGINREFICHFLFVLNRWYAYEFTNCMFGKGRQKKVGFGWTNRSTGEGCCCLHGGRCSSWFISLLSDYMLFSNINKSACSQKVSIFMLPYFVGWTKTWTMFLFLYDWFLLAVVETFLGGNFSYLSTAKSMLPQESKIFLWTCVE